MNLDSILHDKSFELERIEPGMLVGLPDGSDAEIMLADGEAGHYVQQLPEGAFIVVPFATAEEQSAAALAMVRAALLRVF